MRLSVNYDGRLCLEHINGMKINLEQNDLYSSVTASYNTYSWKQVLDGDALLSETNINMNQENQILKDEQRILKDRIQYLENRFKEFDESIPSKLTKLGF